MAREQRQRGREDAAMNVSNCLELGQLSRLPGFWASPLQHSPQKCAHLLGGISISPGPGWLWLGPEMQRHWPGTEAAWKERHRVTGVGSGMGKDTETGEMGREEHPEKETESQPEAETQRDKGQCREKSLRPQHDSINLGGPRKKTMESLAHNVPPFLLSPSFCTVRNHTQGRKQLSSYLQASLTTFLHQPTTQPSFGHPGLELCTWGRGPPGRMGR